MKRSGIVVLRSASQINISHIFTGLIQIAFFVVSLFIISFKLFYHIIGFAILLIKYFSVLSALMRQEDGLIPKLIEKMEIQKEHFRDNAERHLAARVKVSGGQVYVGQDLNKVLIHAEDEAKQMGDEYVSVEHLFLALIKYPNKALNLRCSGRVCSNQGSNRTVE